MSDVSFPEVSIQSLFEVGAHFGHRANKWNPKMEPYIYGERDGSHIINLVQTHGLMQIAVRAVYDVARRNGRILFVAHMSPEISQIIATYATQCGQYYVNHRWLGGTLTNWATISKSIKTLENLEALLVAEKENPTRPKKEILDIERRCEKLLKALGGVRNMGSTPDIVVVFNAQRDHLAIAEAVKLKIPVVAILDTNCDPDNIKYPIPANDDAIRAIQYYCSAISMAALRGMEKAIHDADSDPVKPTSAPIHHAGKRIVKYHQKRKVGNIISDTSQDKMNEYLTSDNIKSDNDNNKNDAATAAATGVDLSGDNMDKIVGDVVS